MLLILILNHLASRYHLSRVVDVQFCKVLAIVVCRVSIGIGTITSGVSQRSISSRVGDGSVARSGVDHLGLRFGVGAGVGESHGQQGEQGEL